MAKLVARSDVLMARLSLSMLVSCAAGLAPASETDEAGIRLRVVLAGSGAGTVRSDIGGIVCPSTCEARVQRTTAVVLTAVPDGDSMISSWSGDCAGTGSSASVVLDHERTCTVTFTRLPQGALLADVVASREVARIPADDAPAGDSETQLFANSDPRVTSWQWRVLDSKSGAEVFTSQLENPIFTCPANRAAYDVELTVSDGASTSTFRHRRLVTCTLPRTPAGRQVIDVDLATSATAFEDGEINGVAVSPGALVRVSGSIGKTWYFANLQGSAEAPIHVINDGLVTNHMPSDIGGSTRLLHCYNCQHVIIDGKGDDAHTYGFVLQNDSTTTAAQALFFKSQSEGPESPAMGLTDLEVFGIHIAGNHATGIEVNTKGAAAYNRDNWQLDGLSIHHTLVEGTFNEGFYIGYTVDWISATYGDTHVPYQIHGAKLYRNVIRNTGKDGMQVCNSRGLEIHDNVVTDVAVNETSGHLSSLQINSGCEGFVFGNHFSGGVGANVQMGCTGDDLFFFSNVLVRGALAGTSAFYLIAGTAADAELHFFANTIISDTTRAFRLNMDSPGCGQPDGTTAALGGLYIANNLMVMADGASAYGCASGACPAGALVTTPNLVRSADDVDDLCFADAPAENYAPSCDDSAATSGVGTALDGLGSVDASGLPLGGFTDLTGRLLDDPRHFGAYQSEGD